MFSWRLVFARTEDNSSTKPSIKDSVLLSKDIFCENISMSRKKHNIMVYVEPNTNKRYSNKLINDGIFVELKVKVGEMVMAQGWARGNKMVTGDAPPGGFFPIIDQGRAKTWFDSNFLQFCTNGLLDPLTTPWAYSSYDSFDFIINKN
jgi:hypothetical protein